MQEQQRHHHVSLLALKITAAALAILAVSVKLGATEGIDTWLLSALREPGDPADPIGPRWFEEMVRDFTALGSTGVLTFVVAVMAGFLWFSRKHWSAAYVVAAVASGTYVNSLLKIEFDRPRPDFVAHGMFVDTASFPSGHSAGAALTYLTLGLLLAHTQESFRVKAYIFAISVLVTFIVGLSRIYLGVHWPTDVLAGWCFGAAWALLVLDRHELARAQPPIGGPSLDVIEVSLEGLELLADDLARPLLDAPERLDDLTPELGERRPAPLRAASRGREQRTLEQLADLVHQKPRPPVRHIHLARGGRDGARPPDALEQLDLARPDLPVLGKLDPELQRGARQRPLLRPSSRPLHSRRRSRFALHARCRLLVSQHYSAVPRVPTIGFG